MNPNIKIWVVYCNIMRNDMTHAMYGIRTISRVIPTTMGALDGGIPPVDYNSGEQMEIFFRPDDPPWADSAFKKKLHQELLMQFRKEMHSEEISSETSSH